MPTPNSTDRTGNVGRDHDLEHNYLHGIENAAQSTMAGGFAYLATAILNDGDRDPNRGARFAWHEVSDLLAEAAEEALDLAAWSALALTNASRLDIDPRAAKGLRADLDLAGIAAVQAFAALNRAMSVSDEFPTPEPPVRTGVYANPAGGDD